MITTGINQKELAVRLETAPSNVNRYLNGEREPGLNVIVRWAEILGVDPSALLKSNSSSTTPVSTRTPTEDELRAYILQKFGIDESPKTTDTESIQKAIELLAIEIAKKQSSIHSVKYEPMTKENLQKILQLLPEVKGGFPMIYRALHKYTQEGMSKVDENWKELLDELEAKEFEIKNLKKNIPEQLEKKRKKENK